MAFADRSTYKDIGDGSIMGRFHEKETGNLFEFSLNNDNNLEFPVAEYPHKIWVTTPVSGIDQGYRYGKVLRTRCHIVCDEDRTEVWHFKGLGRVEYI